MATTEKLDLYKKHRAEYAATRKPQLVTVRPAKYLTIQGRGAPGGDVFQAKIAAMYGMAFTIKFTAKFAGKEYAVCKLEGRWWGKRKHGDFSKEPKPTWNWKLLIRTPDFIAARQLTAAVKQLEQRGKSGDFGDVKLERITEGRCVQMLHVGPYEKEGETMAAMQAFVEQQGLAFHGLHHEIYLSDPRRVEPARLRTILRMPVK
ncbi:MAG: GyrI-like domain-containing protein [Phycisphaerae bacterium]